MKGKIITLVGADGAGKTTQARRLARALGDRGVHIYMGSNPSAVTHSLPTTRAWTGLKRVLGRTVHHSGPPDPGPTPRPASGLRRLRSNLKSLLMVALRASEELYRLAVAHRYAHRGIHVLLDRHPFADYRMRASAEDAGWLRWGDRMHAFLLRRVFPKPMEIVVLDAPADVLHARKPEGSLEALRARRREYLALAREVPPGTRITVLDATRPKEWITEQLLALLGASGSGQAPKKGRPAGPRPQKRRGLAAGRRASMGLVACTALTGACDARSPNEPNVEGPDTLTVMTFNIFHDGERASHGIAPWPERRAGVLDEVRGWMPDVLALQEAESWQVDWFLSELPGYHAVARPVVADASNDNAETLAVLYRREVFVLEESGHFWYSETPDQPGSYGGASFGSMTRPSMATWVRLRRPGRDQGFYVFNTHLVAAGGAADPDRARAMSAQLLLQRMSERSWPEEHLIVTGDLNLEPDDPVFRYLLGGSCDAGAACAGAAGAPRIPMIDTWASRHGDGGDAGTRCNAVSGGRGPRIDYVLVWDAADPGSAAESGENRPDTPEVLDSEIADWANECPSDHRSVTSTIVLP